jgi:basic amino acid/polyamine antiporter, APA family
MVLAAAPTQSGVRHISSLFDGSTPLGESHVMIFWRVKPLDKILETAERKSLKRQLGALQLTLLGVGAVIGTGIFVLTAVAGQKAGPGMMIAFIIAAVVCGLAALAYAEFASMLPVSGSAYTYTYGVLGEVFAWIVGWALVLEYAVGAAVVCGGWANHMNDLLAHIDIGGTSLALPPALRNGPFAGGVFNLLAFLIGLAVTVLLVVGTSKSAKVNSVLVAIKIVALTAFIIIAFPAIKSGNFSPFVPGGWGTPLSGVGVLGAAASIFFAYVGFDAVSTAAEETINPNRNIPIGLIASLIICTIFYLLVGAAAVGAVGSQPILGADGQPLVPGSIEFAQACVGSQALVCSGEPLVHVLRVLNYPWIGTAVGVAAVLALPSVILMMMFGQTRIFFTMSRDGLLPGFLSTVHSRFHTPYVVTIITGIVVSFASAIFPVGALADTSNTGTLLAFAMVSIGVLILRKRDPNKARPFRMPAPWIVCPLAVIGCAVLFMSLPTFALEVFAGWAIFGLLIYTLYSRSRSHLAGATR